jgi:hypothetical protein
LVSPGIIVVVLKPALVSGGVGARRLLENQWVSAL